MLTHRYEVVYFFGWLHWTKKHHTKQGLIVRLLKLHCQARVSEILVYKIINGKRLLVQNWERDINGFYNLSFQDKSNC